MTPHIGWVPVALAGDVESGAATGVRVFGRELVVWRDAAGVSHVWEDRCPHRGMRLSFGFVRGDRLACLYHGWQFDGRGRCRYVPAHPQLDVPETITASPYVSAEQAGLVWVFIGESAPASPPPAGNAEVAPVRSLTVAATLERVLAAIVAGDPPILGEPGATWERTDLLITFRSGSAKVCVAVQPVSATETTLHLGVDPAQGASRKRAVSLWAQAMRREVEQTAKQAGVA